MMHCDRCERHFVHESALQQHLRDSKRHWPCYKCDEDFASWSARRQHYVESWRHYYCEIHEELFDDLDDLEEHYNAEHFRCEFCGDVYDSSEGRDLHKVSEHYYCGRCREFFGTADSMRRHRQSSKHQPRDIPCPARTCAKQFISRADVVLHFQEGGCPSGLGRADAERALVRADPAGLLTDGFFDTSGSTWSCRACARGFANARALCSHLVNSPKHRGRTWRCPEERSGCEARFGKPGAVLQHIYSKSCAVDDNATFFENILDVVLGACRILGEWADE